MVSVLVHVRVMLVIWRFLAAHFVNDAGLLDLHLRGLSTAHVGSCCVISLHRTMGERVNLRAPRHPPVDASHYSHPLGTQLALIISALSKLSDARVEHCESGRLASLQPSRGHRFTTCLLGHTS